MSEQEIRLRASDAEREQVAAQLRQAMADGRLTLAEGEERLAAAYATTYRDELPALTADLPSTGSAPGAGVGGAAGTGAGEPADPAAPEQPDQAGRAGGRRRTPCPVVAPAVLAAAAIATGIWVAATGHPAWPAIVLGVLALVLFKRGRRRHRPA